MRRFGLILICLLALASIPALAGTYTLTDGTKIEGDPISLTDNGVVFRAADGTDLDRLPWDKFTQDALRELQATVKTAREKEMIAPLIEELPQAKEQNKEIVVKPIQAPGRPKTHLGLMAVFGSPVGLMILLVLYGANIFAASEVARYRRQPAPVVCGLAAIPFLGVLSPIIYIAMPTKTLTLDGQPIISDDQAQTRFAATPPPADTAPPPAALDDVAAPGSHPSSVPVATVAEAPPASALPEPIVFRRGDFSFNRRFFETKLAGFFRLVPGEAEKDLVVHIKSGRGDYTGRRITRITPAELYLQVFHDNATADEMIPFVEILEVQIKHKDIA